jgi:hypothetical protein
MLEEDDQEDADADADKNIIAEAVLPPRSSRVDSLQNMENQLPKASLRFDAPESSISKS